MGKAFAAFYIMLKKDDKLEGLKGSKSCMAEASRLWQELSKDDRKHYEAVATGHESAQPADAALESDVVDVAMAHRSVHRMPTRCGTKSLPKLLLSQPKTR